MLHLLESFEIAEACVVARTRTLCLLFDGVSVLPFRIHETDFVFSNYCGTDKVSHRAVIIVKLIFGRVHAWRGDVEFSSAEAITRLRHGVHVGAGFRGIDHLVRDSVEMLVEAGSRKLL